jgi:CHAD domain-containing protein
MALDQQRVCDHPRKVQKSLQKLRKDTSADRVHKLRTGSRQLEALAHSLRLDSKKNERRLLKRLKPIRRRAGRVRDMDVLTGLASRPEFTADRACSVQVLEHLGDERALHARKLQKQVRRSRTPLEKRLKRSRRFLKKSFHRSNQVAEKWAAEAAARALQLEAELRDWPTLNRKNLHPFRLKVKELRYILQLAQGHDTEFVDLLGEVKDAIGQWHDWEELEAIAKEASDHQGCQLLKQIHLRAESEFRRALELSNRMRRQSLSPRSHRSPRRSDKKSSLGIGRPALLSASALAA